MTSFRRPFGFGPSFSGRAAVLSPLDRLVFDRKRMAEIFEFDYQLEMYKPAAKRRWGYWAMPILYGDRLVGKIDATTDQKQGVLRVDAIHRDVPFREDHDREGDPRAHRSRGLARGRPAAARLNAPAAVSDD